MRLIAIFLFIIAEFIRTPLTSNVVQFLLISLEGIQYVLTNSLDFLMLCQIALVLVENFVVFSAVKKRLFALIKSSTIACANS